MLPASKGGAKPKSGTRLTEIIARSSDGPDESEELFLEVASEGDRDLNRSVARAERLSSQEEAIETARRGTTGRKTRPTKKKAE